MSAELDGWAFSYLDRVRFGDLDAMRHLNNVAFLQFFESARIKYRYDYAAGHSIELPARVRDALAQ